MNDDRLHDRGNKQEGSKEEPRKLDKVNVKDKFRGVAYGETHKD